MAGIYRGSRNKVNGIKKYSSSILFFSYLTSCGLVARSFILSCKHAIKKQKMSEICCSYTISSFIHKRSKSSIKLLWLITTLPASVLFNRVWCPYYIGVVTRNWEFLRASYKYDFWQFLLAQLGLYVTRTTTNYTHRLPRYFVGFSHFVTEPLRVFKWINIMSFMSRN